MVTKDMALEQKLRKVTISISFASCLSYSYPITQIITLCVTQEM